MSATIMDDNETTVESNSTNIHDEGRFYHFDNDKLQKLKDEKPWMKNPKYFQKVAVSPSAVMKIMMHCQSGVDKGIAKGGNPIEVMGMLLGRPDPVTPQTLVVTDAFPLPIEGFETRVVADDSEVVNHMIALGESLERSRFEKFMGWYHSHPFDYMPGVDHSHCFLSQTDLSTQLQWQRAEDPHGNPFVAIVVDPLRSAAHFNPEMKAFRAYPPEYNSPIANECPDGSTETSDQVRLEKWGSCWNRYYELNVEYFMSKTSRNVLQTLTQDYLWIRNFNSTPPSKITQQLKVSAKQFRTAAISLSKNNTQQSQQGSGGRDNSAPIRRVAGGTTGLISIGGVDGVLGASMDTATSGAGKFSDLGITGATPTGANNNPSHNEEWTKAVNQISDLAIEQLAESSKYSLKKHMFS